MTPFDNAYVPIYWGSNWAEGPFRAWVQTREGLYRVTYATCIRGLSTQPLPKKRTSPLACHPPFTGRTLTGAGHRVPQNAQ
jgi:hypothetical protein